MRKDIVHFELMEKFRKVKLGLLKDTHIHPDERVVCMTPLDEKLKSVPHVYISTKKAIVSKDLPYFIDCE